MLWDICLGLAALWSGACPLPAPAAPTTAPVQFPASVFEPVATGRGHAWLHRQSGLACPVAAGYFPVVALDPDYPAERPVFCTWDRTEEWLELAAVPLAGSGGVVTLAELELRALLETGIEPEEEWTEAVDASHESRFMRWACGAGRTCLFAAAQRGEWIITLRYRSRMNDTASGAVIWASAMAPRSQ